MPQKKAYIFDFDETLVTTKAKIQVYRNGVFVQSMNSKEYNTYKPKKEDKLDFSEFKDPELILNAKRFKMWPVIKNISDAVKQDKSNSTIYILTARSPIVKSYIYEFLKRNGIEIGIEHIITIGDDAGNINISNEKRKQLKKLAAQYDVITFFDDDPKNIAIAAGIAGIRTRLVESLNEGVFATLPLAQLIKLKKEYTKWFEDYKREGKLPPKRDWLRRDIKRNSSSLKELKKEYDELTTEIAKKYIQAMQTNEEMGGVGAPMATPMNVPGMGNVSPGGSGDKFGSIGKPYTQTAKPKKKKKIVKKKVQEAFKDETDPVKDMGIGIQGLWDLTPEEAAVEIWAVMKEKIQKQVAQSLRNGNTFRISPSDITEYGCMTLALEPDNETFKYLTKLVHKEINKSIKDHTLNLHSNIKYPKLEEDMNEQNINPYDKMGMAMAKKMGVKPPFKKKKCKRNQNAMVQQKFEHSILTFDDFQNLLNENK